MEELRGSIVWIIRDRGFGFIRAEIAYGGIEYFFHRSGCDDRDSFDHLNENDTVVFEEEHSPKGPRAGHVRRLLS